LGKEHWNGGSLQPGFAQACSRSEGGRSVDAGGRAPVLGWDFDVWCLASDLAFERLEPGRQGKPKLSKLDVHETFILALVDTDDRDITLTEIAEHLATERGSSLA